MSVNLAIILGRLGRDPNLTEKGACRFSVATGEKYKDKNGENVENTEWHNIICFGKLGEIANKHLSKGLQVYIEGKLQTRKYQGKDGVEKQTTEILAHNIQFIDRKPLDAAMENEEKRVNSQQGDNSAYGGHNYSQTYRPVTQNNDRSEYTADDLPF